VSAAQQQSFGLGLLFLGARTAPIFLAGAKPGGQVVRRLLIKGLRAADKRLSPGAN